MFSKHVTLSIPQVLAFLVVVSTQLVCLVFQRPHKATADEMTKYHSDDYIKFLRSIRPDNMSEFSKQMQRCKSSCPLWDITEFCILFQVRNTRSSFALLFPFILLKLFTQPQSVIVLDVNTEQSGSCGVLDYGV